MTIVYTVEWHGDEDCGGINIGCIGVFSEKLEALVASDSEIIERALGYINTEGPDEFTPDNTVEKWRGDGRDQLLIREWEMSR